MCKIRQMESSDRFMGGFLRIDNAILRSHRVIGGLIGGPMCVIPRLLPRNERQAIHKKRISKAEILPWVKTFGPDWRKARMSPTKYFLEKNFLATCKVHYPSVLVDPVRDELRNNSIR